MPPSLSLIPSCTKQVSNHDQVLDLLKEPRKGSISRKADRGPHTEHLCMPGLHTVVRTQQATSAVDFEFGASQVLELILAGRQGQSPHLSEALNRMTSSVSVEVS